MIPRRYHIAAMVFIYWTLVREIWRIYWRQPSPFAKQRIRP